MRKNIGKILLTGMTVAIVAITLTGCASCQRFFKSVESNWGVGLHRTIEIYDVNGEKIRDYSGKFDITFDDDTGRLLFDDEKGKRHQIFPGASTVLIDEN